MGASRQRPPVARNAITRRTSLSIPAAITIDAWVTIGEELFIISDASIWWLGDWLVYGQDRYPDRYKRAIERTSLQYKTLRNYAWVARKFEVSRRRDSLSFQHHAEVAALPEDEQEVWLDRAEFLRLPVTELRRQIKAARSGAEGQPSAPEEIFGFDIDPERRNRWENAAEQASSTLHEWILSILDQETRSVLGSESGRAETFGSRR
jgi:hypothetical protein